MRLRSLAFFLISATASFAALASASEVCAIRPDLCAEQKASPKKKCRIKGQPYSLTEADLPYCAKTATIAAQPADVPKFDFDSYMNANAAEPAIKTHQLHQKAFEDNAKPVTFNFSNGDGQSVREPDVVPAPMPTASSSTSGAPVPNR